MQNLDFLVVNFAVEDDAQNFKRLSFTFTSLIVSKDNEQFQVYTGK